MNIVLDVIVLAMIIIPIVTSVMHGFVKSISKIASCILAIVLAVSLTPLVSSKVNGLPLTEKVENDISSAIMSICGSDEKASEELKDDDSELCKYLAKIGIDIYEVKEDIGNNVKETISKIAASAADFVTEKLVYCLCFAGIFIIVFIAARIAFFLLQKVVSLPVIDRFDKLLGALLGVITSFLLLTVFVSFAKTALPYLSNINPGLFSENLVEKTLVYKYIADFLPNLGTLLK